MIKTEEENKEEIKGTYEKILESPLMKDENFKIMFNRKEPLTVLVSRVLELPYEDVEGKVETKPLTEPKKEKGKKKEERDLVASVSLASPTKIIIEVTYDARCINNKGDYFLDNREDWKGKVKRNVHYLSESVTNSIEKGETFEKIVRTILVDFTPYFLDSNYKEAIERCFMTTSHGKKITDLLEYININVVECAKLCYNGTYKRKKYNKFEKDLIVLGALIQARGEDEAKGFIKRINISKEIQESIKGVLEDMSKDDLKWGRSYDPEEEKERIYQTAINLAKNDGREEGKQIGLELGIERGIERGIEQKEQEIIMSMYKKGYELSEISQILNLNISKVEQIIADSNNNKIKSK